MKLLTLPRKQIDWKTFIRRGALEEDVGRGIDEPCKVFDQQGELVCIYDMLEADTGPLVENLHRIKYSTSTRTGGLVTTSRIFGSAPRLERRMRAFCNRTTLAREQPEENAAICGMARYISDRYKLMDPETWLRHEMLTGDVRKEWVLDGSVFTSGIINKNNPLHYHFDAGNFDNVLSAMLVLRKNMEGGWLNLPEFDCRFMLKNNAIFMFDGQKILHGVTPMKKAGEDSYRYSIVFYSLKGMWKCLTLDEELANAREKELAKLR